MNGLKKAVLVGIAFTGSVAETSCFLMKKNQEELSVVQKAKLKHDADSTNTALHNTKGVIADSLYNVYRENFESAALRVDSVYQVVTAECERLKAQPDSLYQVLDGLRVYAGEILGDAQQKIRQKDTSARIAFIGKICGGMPRDVHPLMIWMVTSMGESRAHDHIRYRQKHGIN